VGTPDSRGSALLAPLSSHTTIRTGRAGSFARKPDATRDGRQFENQPDQTKRYGTPQRHTRTQSGSSVRSIVSYARVECRPEGQPLPLYETGWCPPVDRVTCGSHHLREITVARASFAQGPPRCRRPPGRVRLNRGVLGQQNRR
jgi:hypothetical protein